jgi:hypothetical protein
MEAKHSSETSVLTRVTRPYNPEDGILRGHRREDFSSYKSVIHPDGSQSHDWWPWGQDGQPPSLHVYVPCAMIRGTTAVLSALIYGPSAVGTTMRHLQLVTSLL